MCQSLGRMLVPRGKTNVSNIVSSLILHKNTKRIVLFYHAEEKEREVYVRCMLTELKIRVLLLFISSE